MCCKHATFNVMKCVCKNSNILQIVPKFSSSNLSTSSIYHCFTKRQFNRTNVLVNHSALNYCTKRNNARNHDALELEPENTKQYDYLVRAVSGMKSISQENVYCIRDEVKLIGNHISDYNFDAIFLEACRAAGSFSVGRDFFYLLYSQNKCNLATIGKFFRMCGDFPTECSDDDKSFLIKLYHNLIDKYSMLDGRTCESMIIGLAITQQWKDGLKILDMARFSMPPSLKMYAALVQAAFFNKDIETAKMLLQDMVSNNREPTPDVYKAWLEASGVPAIYEILEYAEKYDIHISLETARLLIDFCKKPLSPFSCHVITAINNSGECKNCQRPLKSITVTPEDFEKLRDAFLNPVLIGKNIFLKTKPDEMANYFSFLKRMNKVDVVLDGLNIAYASRQTHDKNITSFFLSHVVEHFVKLSKKVAVIGRKHMKQWPKNHFNFIRNNSFLFLADNVSVDDPFILYTAMHSGLGTSFVSRDQMRSHKFLLKGSELDKVFSKWQQKHQIYLQHISPSGTVLLAKPTTYLRSAQESEPGVWHIPIVTPMEGVPPHSVASKTKWLCLK